MIIEVYSNYACRHTSRAVTGEVHNILVVLWCPHGLELVIDHMNSTLDNHGTGKDRRFTLSFVRYFRNVYLPAS